MFTNIIRGGQLFLHAIRMFRQVFKFLIYITFLAAILIYLTKAYFTIRLEELGGFYDLWRAKILIACWMKKTKLSVYYMGGMVDFEAEVVPYIKYVTKRANLFCIKLVQCAYFTGQVISVLFVVLTIFLVRRGMQKSGVKFNRGAKLERFEEIKKEILSNNKSRKYRSYSLAGMPYPYYSEMEHTLIVGSTGVGKTVLISDLVEQIRKRKDKAIIYDKKGDYVQWFYDKSKDFILNPFDTRSSNWNLLAEMEHVAQLKPLAQAFIADGPGQIDNIWNEAGRIAFSSILEKFVIEGREFTNQEIVDMLLKQDMKSLEELAKNTYAQSLIDSNSPRTTGSILMVLSSYLNSLRLTKGSREDSFSIRKWLRDENRDSILFISSNESFKATLSPLLTAWFEIGISGILSLPQSLNRKTWVILDELPTLNKIPSLAQGLAVARSYGGCFVLGIQNIAQMREIYGRNTTEDISSECNTRCMFKTNDPDTAKWLVQNLGEEDITEFKEGLSYGAHAMRDGINVSEYNRIRNIVLPSEIQHMKKLNLLVKMPDYPAGKIELQYKERNAPEKPFLIDEKTSKRSDEIRQVAGIDSQKSKKEIEKDNSEDSASNISNLNEDADTTKEDSNTAVKNNNNKQSNNTKNPKKLENKITKLEESNNNKNCEDDII